MAVLNFDMQAAIKALSDDLSESFQGSGIIPW